MTESAPGTFYCSLCDASYPDVLAGRHMSDHGPTGKPDSRAPDAWALMAAGALIVVGAWAGWLFAASIL